MTTETEHLLPRALKIAGQFLGSIVAVLGAFWAIDNHYASAADMEKITKSFDTQVRSLRQERVEDEIFKLEMKKERQKGKLSPEDTALYNRYMRRIESTVREQKAADTK